MAKKYAPSASKDVEHEMHKFKHGQLKSGRGGKGGTMTSRKQAIAIGLSEGRKKGKEVAKNKASRNMQNAEHSTTNPRRIHRRKPPENESAPARAVNEKSNPKGFARLVRANAAELYRALADRTLGAGRRG